MHYRPTSARIDLPAILHNYQRVMQLAPNGQAMAVLKANAYGHGAVDVARYLEPHVPAFAVAFMDEALALREQGISKPILLLEGIFQPGELALAAEHNFWLMFHSEHQLRMLEKVSLNKPVNCWLKLDTGMHRLGLDQQQLQSWLPRLSAMSQVRGKPVVCSHFACAEQEQSQMNLLQQQQLLDLVAGTGCEFSLANSAALLGLPDAVNGWNRPGIMLYGCSSVPGKSPSELGLKPAMTVTSQVMALHTLQKGETVGYGAYWQAEGQSLIATLAIGYADGYPRLINSSTEVFLHGQRARVVGAVSMDMLAVEVTHLPQVRIGDTVEIWGENILVSEVAASANTIGYELLTRINQRMPRTYVR
ncbi:alanine racemase [Bowmanella dokdonensis]|uniref:Alanine racemase n=1 Tax=Bowmanella dokdonensis TaxID=751969 RepID=A0A939IPB7_9ALTE|nr:alanine racemase [Bowmanella dokdonensis]MBN7827278.1 alanine racemase [Bowmanella dokdonensis]